MALKKRNTRFMKEGGILLIALILVILPLPVTAHSYGIQPQLLNSTQGTLLQIPGEQQSFADDVWLHYDNGTNCDAIGFGAGSNLEYGIRLTPEELEDYNGQKLTMVRFHYGWWAMDPVTTSGSVKIYGTGTEQSPGELLIEEPYMVTEAGWFDVILSHPLTINGYKDLWVCISLIQQNPYAYPAGAGPGPMVPGKGGWFKWEGSWYQLANDMGLDYNWNIWVGIIPVGCLTLDTVFCGVGVNAMILNQGSASAQDVNWTIRVMGGQYENINKKVSGTISQLSVDKTKLIRSGIIFGSGRIHIIITVEATNGNTIREEFRAVAYGPFIFYLEKM